MAKLTSLLGNNSSIVSSATTSTVVTSSGMDDVAKHINAGELVVCMESNTGNSSSANTIFNIVGGGIYTYSKNKDKAFGTTCPMGFSLAVKGDYSSAKSYYDKGEFTRLIPSAVDSDAPSLESLQQHLKDAQALLSKATAKTKANIEMMILNLEHQIELASATQFTSEVMTRDDWALICKNQGMETGEIKFFFPLKFNADELMDIRRDKSIKGVKIYFLVSNVGMKTEEIYPRKSNLDESNTLISVNAEGEERHGLIITVTPIHVEFVDERFSHAKQLYMLDPTGFNASAKMFADRDKTSTETVFHSLDATVATINIRAKKLPQAQAMMESYLAKDGVWLSDVERQLEFIAKSKQFFSFGITEYNKYIVALTIQYPNCVINDVAVSETELKKGKLNDIDAIVASALSFVDSPKEEAAFVNPLDTDDEINQLLAG
jgi:hypothetical protein